MRLLRAHGHPRGRDCQFHSPLDKCFIRSLRKWVRPRSTAKKGASSGHGWRNFVSQSDASVGLSQYLDGKATVLSLVAASSSSIGGRMAFSMHSSIQSCPPASMVLLPTPHVSPFGAKANLKVSVCLDSLALAAEHVRPPGFLFALFFVACFRRPGP